MPRAVWTGTLSFGLVTIPVALFPATDPKDVRSHLMDARGRRVRYRRFVSAEEPIEPPGTSPPEPFALSEGTAGTEPAPPADAETQGEPAPAGSEREIAFEDLMRGFETEGGGVVLLGREEIEEARPKRSRTIEIEDFVALSDIDPVYFEKSYHLAPRPGGDRPYVLLLTAMERAGRVGIGRFVLRTKPHLVAIRPAEGVLGLETMFFSDEVRSGRELVRSVEGIEASERELEMAEMLIETLKTEWNPAAYADTYREELLRRIREKVPIEPAPEAERADVSGPGLEELMAALKASVEEAKGTKRSPKARKRKPA
jgi:DNA end-binding protein Ku